MARSSAYRSRRIPTRARSTLSLIDLGARARLDLPYHAMRHSRPRWQSLASTIAQISRCGMHRNSQSHLPPSDMPARLFAHQSRIARNTAKSLGHRATSNDVAARSFAPCSLILAGGLSLVGRFIAPSIQARVLLAARYMASWESTMPSSVAP